MDDFLSVLHSGRVLVADGAIGTVLAERGYAGVLPEEVLLIDPDTVYSVHADYARAGARMLTTDTFGANRLKLAEFGIADRQEEIVARAVRAAREAASEHSGVFVAGSIGPLGSFMMPFGTVDWPEALDNFGEVARLLVEEGVDLVVVETMTDLRELRAATMAVRRISPDIPMILQMSFDSGERTVTGTPIEVFVRTAEALGPQAIGSNCGTALENMESVARGLGRLSRLPFSVQPNAGVPRIENGRTVFPATPEQMAATARSLAASGATVVGSCCGSTPAHTRAIAEAVGDTSITPGSGSVEDGPALTACSRTSSVSFGRGFPFVPVGERINPSGRKRLTRELRAGKLSMIKRLASRQVEAGAMALDINLGIGDEASEREMMPRVIRALGNSVSVPLLIDSPFASVVEAGLEECACRPIINSVSGNPSSLEAILPLARRYGASVVALLMDDTGIRESSVDRLAILDRILEAVLASGLGMGSVIVDPVVLPLISTERASRETFRVIEAVRDDYGLPTIIGLSNISFGLPARSLINRSYLTMAIDAGVDAAILNPLDDELMRGISAAEVISGRDADGVRFVSLNSDGPPEDPGATAARADEAAPGLREMIIQGNSEEAEEAVLRLLQESASPMDLVDDVLIPAIRQVGDWYEEGRIYLPHLIASADAVQRAFDSLRSALERESSPGEPSGPAVRTRGVVMLATVEGDVHDIGKNIIRTVLGAHGYRVIDLGKNVGRDRILDMILRESPGFLGLSALLTPSLVSMRQTIDFLREKLDSPPVILVGGAVVTPGFAEEAGVLYAGDAIEAARVLDDLTGRKA